MLSGILISNPGFKLKLSLLITSGLAVVIIHHKSTSFKNSYAKESNLSPTVVVIYKSFTDKGISGYLRGL